MKVLVVGGVAGGASAAARLRRLTEKAGAMQQVCDRNIREVCVQRLTRIRVDRFAVGRSVKGSSLCP